MSSSQSVVRDMHLKVKNHCRAFIYIHTRMELAILLVSSWSSPFLKGHTVTNDAALGCGALSDRWPIVLLTLSPE